LSSVSASARKREVALVATTIGEKDYRGFGEIPQIDVSMHLPNYPGRQGCLFGLRLLLEESPRTGSRRIPVDLLFRADSVPEFLRAAWQLLPIKYTLQELLPLRSAAPYPTEILQSCPSDFSSSIPRGAEPHCPAPRKSTAKLKETVRRILRMSPEVLSPAESWDTL